MRMLSAWRKVDGDGRSLLVGGVLLTLALGLLSTYWNRDYEAVCGGSGSFGVEGAATRRSASIRRSVERVRRGDRLPITLQVEINEPPELVARPVELTAILKLDGLTMSPASPIEFDPKGEARWFAADAVRAGRFRGSVVVSSRGKAVEWRLGDSSKSWMFQPSADSLPVTCSVVRRMIAPHEGIGAISAGLGFLFVAGTIAGRLVARKGQSPRATAADASPVADGIEEYDPSEGRPIVVIRVHGTFASSEGDCGEAWWQAGSSFVEDLAARTRSIAIDWSERPFHWSGENSERARQEAAQDLLERLLGLEAANKRYFIIAHSHGGSVAWKALLLETVGRRTAHGLQHFMGWVTVGTPFLRYRPCANTWRQIGVVVAVLVATSPLLAAMGRAGGRAMRLLEVDAAVALSLFPVLFPLFLLALVAPVFPALYVFSLSSAESRHLVREHKSEAMAWCRYGGKWLGLWSPDDEAIAGLIRSLGAAPRLSQRYTPRRGAFVSERNDAWGSVGVLLERVAEHLEYSWDRIFNWAVAPRLDRSIWARIAASIHGNDRPGIQAIGVSTTPCDLPTTPPALPSSVVKSLADRADNGWHALIPAARLALGLGNSQSRTGVVVSHLSSSLTDTCLVHTGYFADPNVRTIILLRLLDVAGRPQANLDREMAGWLCQFGIAIDAEPRQAISAPSAPASTA